MKKTTLSALSLVIALTAGAAFAVEDAKPVPPKGAEGKELHKGPEGKGPHPMFKENDKNGDGVISKDEWRVKGEQMFSETDTNKDGNLSPEELKARHEARRAEMKQKWQEHKQEREELKGKVEAGKAGEKPVIEPAKKQ
jgi:hypothetical protein